MNMFEIFFFRIRTIAEQFSIATLESVVRIARKKKDTESEPKTWAEFTMSGADYRQSQGIFHKKLDAKNTIDEVLIFAKKEAVQDLKDATMINVHVIRDVTTQFTSNICVIHKIVEKKVRSFIHFIYICIYRYSYN